MTLVHQISRTVWPCFLLLTAMACQEDKPEGNVLYKAEESPGAVSGTVEVVLYSRDPRRNTYGFTAGDYGCIVRDGELRNINSQLAFATSAEDRLVASTNAGEAAVLFNVGTLRDDGDRATIFWRIEKQGSDITARRAGGSEHEVLGDLGEPTPGLKSVAIKVGDIVIVGLKSTREAAHGEAEQRAHYVKLYIIDHAPDRYVRFLWERLE